MIAPQMKSWILISSTMLLAACGSGGGSKSGGGILPAQPVDAPKPTDEKLKLKYPGTNKVVLGAVRDLRRFIINPQNAAFTVVDGANLVAWEAGDLPKLKFKEIGEVTVLVNDKKTGDALALKFQVIFDTTGMPDELPIDEVELPPVDGPIIL